MVKKIKDNGDKMINTFYNKIVYKPADHPAADDKHNDVFYKTVLVSKGPNQFNAPESKKPEAEPYSIKHAVKRDLKILVDAQVDDDLKYLQRGLSKAKSVGRHQLQTTNQGQSPFAATRLVSVRNNGIDEECCLWG